MARSPSEAAAPAPAPTPAKAAVVTAKQLAAQLAEAHAMERRQAGAVMADVVGLLISPLRAGDRPRLGGLGTLEARHRPARAGRNPATGAAIQIAASRTVAFRPARELKEAI